MRSSPVLRRCLALLLVIAWGFGWGRMEHAGGANVVVEPTTEAVQRAAASLLQGYLGAAVVVIVAVVSAALFRRHWLLVTALPGLTVGVLLATAPASSLGGLLLSSFIVLGIVAWRIGRRWRHAATTDR